MPADQQIPGEEQEARVRSRLVTVGFEQPYGASDDEIRRNLGIRGRCADFVGYHPQRERWLIAESKGSDLDTAEKQLLNTLIGLLSKVPRATGKIDLQVHVRANQYDKLPGLGLSGYRLNGLDHYLGHFIEGDVWHYVEVAGIKVVVVREGN